MTIALFKVFPAACRHIEIAQAAILDTVNPAMERNFASTFPGGLQNRGMPKIINLLNNVDFAKFIQAVSFYQAAIPTYYGGIMTFAWASDNPALRQPDAALLQARFEASGLRCRYYTPAIHTGSFALPQYLLNALEDPR